MSLESLNFAVFSLINAAPDATSLSIHFAIFIAQYLLYFLAFFLGYLWLQGTQDMKARALKAVVFTAVALSISFVISHTFYHPRPFAIPLGQNYLYHEANGSFPSDHMLIFSTIAFSYLFALRKIAGLVLMALAWAVAWSRVYLGVHFPLDMIGGFSLAFLVNLIGLPVWNKYGQSLLNMCLKIYYAVFSQLIQKGILK